MSSDVSELIPSGSATASAVVYDKLKTALLVGAVPIGVRLREERIAERFGTSRTPVREALLRLHAERFLERHPGGGYKATNPSAQTMRELYEIRLALELLALRRGEAAGGHDRDALAELREEWLALAQDSAEVDAEFVHLDEDFHQRLADAAGNRQLAEQLRPVIERIRPVRTHDFVTPGRIGATIEQHVEIIDAVLAKEIARAEMLLDRHIGESQSVVEVAVAQVLERMLTSDEGETW